MGYRVVSLGDVIQLEDSKRQPLSSRERDSRRGIYPYYGAQGIVDYLDDYTYEGDYLLVAEDGETLGRENSLLQMRPMAVSELITTPT